MAIEVFIKRKVKQGPQARSVVPLILQLRSLATFQPGYISGETFFNLDNPEEGIDLDCVPHRSRPAELDVALSNSFGFGGTNVSLAMRRYRE